MHVQSVSGRELAVSTQNQKRADRQHAERARKPAITPRAIPANHACNAAIPASAANAGGAARPAHPVHAAHTATADVAGCTACAALAARYGI